MVKKYLVNLSEVHTKKGIYVPKFYNVDIFEVKWDLGSITTKTTTTTSEGDGIPAELFQIPKDDAVKMQYSICQQIWKTQQWPQDWKRSFFIPNQKEGIVKECSNYCTIAVISHASRVTLKILQARLQQNQELPDVQGRFRKAEEPEIKWPTSVGSLKNQESSRKTSTSASLTMLKTLCGSQQTVENF